MKKVTQKKETIMTPKKEMFCREYIIDFNATQAYIRAGYKAKNDNTASVMAHKLLTDTKIQEKITQLKEKREEELKINALWVLNEAVQVYRMAKGELPCIMGARDKEGVMQKVEIHKTNLKEANRALEIIGKHVTVKAFEKEIDLGDNVVITVTAPNFEQ